MPRSLVMPVGMPRSPNLQQQPSPARPPAHGGLPRAAAGVPVYKLYGEQQQWLTPDMVHCETIAARSRLHNWEIAPHRHHGLFQMLFLTSGQAEVTLEERKIHMSGGQLLTVPEMCIHGFRFSRNAGGFVITLAYPLLAQIGPELGEFLLAPGRPLVHTLADAEAGGGIAEGIAAFAQAYRDTGPLRSLLLQSLLGAALVRIARNAMMLAGDGGAGPMASDQYFQRYCRAVEEHFDTRRPVSWYATEIGISAAHLNVLCRKAVNRSAQEIIHDRVMLEAKRLLVYTATPIGEVCLALGFSDPAYFTRFFKRETGVSPRDFRMRARTASP